MGLVSLVSACRSPEGADLSFLADRPALPCSVLLTGGAFLRDGGVEAGDGSKGRTFSTASDEAFALAAVGDLLVRARVFVRTETDARSSAERQALAGASAAQVGDVPAFDGVLRQARADGHDYLLVLERLDDGPVQALGVNGQWPITLSTWLLVGLGALIPDHGYESRASLRASLRDVHDGHAVQELVIGASTVDLSLLERSGVWGWIQSILVPPFWVGDDDERVVQSVRVVVEQRLMIGLAQRLKSVDVADRLTRRQPAAIEVQRGRDGSLGLDVTARESVSFLRLRVDDEVVAGDAFDGFHRAFLGSRLPAGDALRYHASLPRLPAGDRLQVLVQTITGRVGSVSFDLRQLP
ncbi:MAG: hypothetical protein R3F56_16080 [Planctomycetota bacterium]